MDAITQAAITSLTSAVTALLPPVAAPVLPPQLRVFPQRVTPTGLGGFVGHHPEPTGEILGRRLAAQLFVTARASTAEAAEGAAGAVAQALLGASQAELRGSGILRLALAERGEVQVTGQGNSQVTARELEFAVLYEFLRVPVEAEGVIERVPLFVELGSTEAGGDVLIRTGFGAGALDRFEVFDDPAAAVGGPSQWAVDVPGERITQSAGIRGGGDTVSPEKPGTYLVLRSGEGLPEVRDFVLGVELRSAGQDEIGLVFRWRSVDDFYLLLLSARQPYRMLARKVGGVFSALDVPAVDMAAGYLPGDVHSVRVTAQGDAIRVHVDGEAALEGRDAAIAEAGRVGFYCRANPLASFHHIELLAL